MANTYARYGARESDWTHFDVVLGLTEHMLPVVANPRIPISPISGLKKVGKVPSTVNRARQVVGFAGWPTHQTTSKEVASWSRKKDLGVSLQCREVRALDVDIPDAVQAEAVKLTIARMLGNVSCRGRADSSKFLVGFYLKGAYQKRVLRTKHGIIEFLADGQQFIAAGRHPDGALYRWGTLQNPTPPALPTFDELTPEAFEKLFNALALEFGVEEVQQNAKSTRSTKLVDVLTLDPVAAHLTATDRVLHIAKDGRIDFRCPWEGEHTDPDGGSASATSYWPAHTGGYAQGHFKCQHAHCGHRTDADFQEAIGYRAQQLRDAFPGTEDADEGVADTPEGADVRALQPGRFALTQGAQFARDDTAVTWLIKDIIPHAPLGVLYGASGSGKTFFALDLGLALARGTDWRGHKCDPEAGAVVYIAAEGAAGMRRRLRAYSQHSNIDLDSYPFWIITDVPALTVRDDAVAVAKAIRGKVGCAGLVIVDTLARTMLGANENSGEDMGAVLANCDGIHRATGAMVLLVHHSGKDGAKGARGWSGLRAASDLEIEVSRLENARVARVTKLKDGEDGDQFGFELHSVILGVDEDGDDITSCVVRPASGGLRHRSRAARSKVGALLLEALDASHALNGAAQESAVLDATMQKLPWVVEGKRDTRAQRVLRSLEALIADRVISREGVNLVRVVAT